MINYIWWRSWGEKNLSKDFITDRSEIIISPAFGWVNIEDIIFLYSSSFLAKRGVRVCIKYFRGSLIRSPLLNVFLSCLSEGLTKDVFTDKGSCLSYELAIEISKSWWNSKETSLIYIINASFHPSPMLITVRLLSINFTRRTKYCLCSAFNSYAITFPTLAKINAKCASKLWFVDITSNYFDPTIRAF